MTRRTKATRVVRTVVGVVGVAAATATVLLAGRLDLPVIGTAPASVTVEPVAADQTRVCAGSLLELGQDAASATTAASLGAPAVAAGSGIAGPADATAMAAPDDAAGRGGPTLLTAPPRNDGSTLAGAQSESVASERIAGFAATACTEATSDAWLVGGSSDVGQTTLVSIANPSTVEAVVTLEVFGESGPVEAPGAAGIVIAPGTQRVVSLAGFAPNLVIPVVHVTSVGAAVTATLQQSSIRSITPEGADIVGSTAAPAVEQLIPGFEVPRTRPVERADSYDYRVPGVRVLVPGRFDGEVTVVAVQPDGTESEPRTVVAASGEVIDVPLDELDPGSYALRVTSDQPVVAAAHSTASGDDRDDSAWFAASAPLDAVATVAVAPGPSPVLTIVNPTGEERTVLLDSADDSVELTVGAGGSVVRSVDPDTVYTVDDTEGLHAAVTLLGGAGFASYPVLPPSAASDPVVVRTR